MLPNIAPLDPASPLAEQVRARWLHKTKPPGSLGRLEDLALQLALIQHSAAPRAERARVVVFAADHGVVEDGVSPYPQAVTAQMVANFLAGGAAISVLARQQAAQLLVVDAGIAHPVAAHPGLLDCSQGKGTANLRHTAAMTRPQAEACLQQGAAIAGDHPGNDVLVLGEMGIGNTTAAAALLHALSGWPVEACVGRGTGVDAVGLARKREVVAEAVQRHGRFADPIETLRHYGGFEIAMLAGAMLGAAQARQLVIVDGFIATAAYAIAAQLRPALRDYVVFGHVSAEGPHREWLRQLDGRALLDLDLRLGEGTGALLALPLLRAACALLADMATFDSAGVSDRDA